MLTRTIEGERGGGGLFGLVFLSLFVLFCQANTHTHTHRDAYTHTCLHTHTHTHMPAHTHTHTHMHTHTLLSLLSGHHQGTHLHCNYITLFFSHFSFEIRKLYNYLFYLSGMSIFFFSAEFHFYFLLSAFLKIIFPLFWKVADQKIKNKKPVADVAAVGRVQRASVSGCSLFPFLVKVPKHGHSALYSKSDTRNHAQPRGREGEGGCEVVGWRIGGAREWSQLRQSVYFDHQTPAFALLSLPPPLSPITLHTQRHARTHTHTHTVVSSHLKSLSLSLSLAHTEIFSTFLLTPTHIGVLQSVSVESSEHAKNSMTRRSPYNPSPFPLFPHLPTTAQSLQAGNRQQLF